MFKIPSVGDILLQSACGSMKPSILAANFTSRHPTHVHNKWQPYVFAVQTRSISCCRNSTCIRVRFWRQLKIGSIQSCCSQYSKRNLLQLGNVLSNRPLYKDMVKLVCWREHKKKLEKTSLSNDTVRCRISEITRDILDQVADEIRASKSGVSVQLDGWVYWRVEVHVFVALLSIYIWRWVERRVTDVQKFRND